MNGMRRETLQPPSASAKSYVRQSTPSRQIRRRGHAMAAVFGGMSSPAIPSASCTSFAAMTLRSSLLPTVAGDRDTGDRDSETPSNEPLERAGMITSRPVDCVSAGRSAPIR